MESQLEKILTRSYKSQLIAYLTKHPEEFDELLKLALSNKQPYSWRGTWLLWSCMVKDDIRVKKHVSEIIDSLLNRPDNQQREILIVLQKLNIEEEHEGRLFNSCISIWESTSKQYSVRYNAFKLLLKIAKKYPELLNEVFSLAQSPYLDTFSMPVRKSLLRMISG